MMLLVGRKKMMIFVGGSLSSSFVGMYVVVSLSAPHFFGFLCAGRLVRQTAFSSSMEFLS